MPLLIPQAIAWTLGVLGAALVGRFIGKHWRRMQDELHPRGPWAGAPASGPIPVLRRDPQSGIYRPDP